jgi:hypothetical protein
MINREDCAPTSDSRTSVRRLLATVASLVVISLLLLVMWPLVNDVDRLDPPQPHEGDSRVEEARLVIEDVTSRRTLGEVASADASSRSHLASNLADFDTRCRLRVRVCEENGDPVGSSVVVVRDRGSWGVLGCPTRSDGVAEFDELRTGWALVGTLTDPPIEVDLVSGLNEVRLVAPSARRVITIRVVDQSGLVVVGAEVLVSASAYEPDGFVFGQTDINGELIFGISDTERVVAVTHPRYLPSGGYPTRSPFVDDQGLLTIIMESGQVTSFECTVVDERTRQPVVGARIALLAEARTRTTSLGNRGMAILPPAPFIGLLTDQRGVARFSPVSLGLVRARAVADGFAMQERILGPEELAHPGFVWALTADVPICGTVTDGAGNAVAGALVETQTPDGVRLYELTSASGRFTLRGLAPGPVSLLASKGPLLSGTLAIAADERLAEKSVVLELRAAASAVARLVSESGSAQVGWRVELCSASVMPSGGIPRSSISTASDSDGRVFLAPHEDQVGDLVVWRDVATDLFPLLVHENVVGEEDVIVACDGDFGTLEIVLTADIIDDGYGLLQIHNVARGWSTIRAVVDGRCLLKGVPSGWYALTCLRSRPFAAREWARVFVDGGATSHLECDAKAMSTATAVEPASAAK